MSGIFPVMSLPACPRHFVEYQETIVMTGFSDLLGHEPGKGRRQGTTMPHALSNPEEGRRQFAYASIIY
ncbi:MAG TPA: hypothetical protein VFG67_10095 [Oleiagrimonas sp.]|nr:hypothetical protein [Oleiagrimonas sp.]